MDPGEQPPQDGNGMNMTRALEALAPYLKHPRRTVIELEALVFLAVFMLFLQLFLAPRRRRSNELLLQGFLWFVYTISAPLMTYIFTQMATSPVKNVLYPFWAVLLLWAAGYTNVFTVYSIEDSKQWKRSLFDLAQYFFYSFLIYMLLDPYGTRPRSISFAPDENNIIPPEFPFVSVLCISTAAVLCSNCLRILAVWNITNSNHSKFVADYMRAQVDGMKGPEEPFFDPITMKGYRYLVVPYVPFSWTNGRLSTRVKEDITTIKEIWDMKFDFTNLNTPIQGGNQLKLVSLSFALYQLLRRRFFRMDCAEAGLPQTRKFALEGLLTEEDQDNHYSTAFDIIQVELGFLYDVFFTTHAVIFPFELQFLTFVLVKFIFTFFLGIFLLGYFPTILTPDPIIEVGTRRVDVIVTSVIILALLLLETLQVMLYFASDWAIVSLAWSYAIWDSRPHHSNCKLLISISQFLRKKLIFTSKKMFGSTNMWQNKMGQSSLFECCLSLSSSHGPLEVWKLVQTMYMLYVRSMWFSNKTFQEVPPLIRSEIVSCLRTYNGGPLTNGETALHLNGVHDDFSCALRNNSQAVVMLIWHIATEYCTIASSHEEDYQVHRQQEEKVKLENYKQVATTLSKYCAYLMFFIPELLPGNATDTIFVLHDILLEGSHVLGKGKLSRDELLKAITDSESSSDNNEDTIFVKGLKLGRDLEKEDVALRWKVLAEFWAETIIYIAPSDNVEAHMELLAQGGEFLTHVWALLTHAGILKRD